MAEIDDILAQAEAYAPPEVATEPTSSVDDILATAESFSSPEPVQEVGSIDDILTQAEAFTPTGQPSVAQQQFETTLGLDESDPNKLSPLTRRPSGDIQTPVAEVTSLPVGAGVEPLERRGVGTIAKDIGGSVLAGGAAVPANLATAIQTTGEAFGKAKELIDEHPILASAVPQLAGAKELIKVAGKPVGKALEFIGRASSDFWSKAQKSTRKATISEAGRKSTHPAWVISSGIAETTPQLIADYITGSVGGKLAKGSAGLISSAVEGNTAASSQKRQVAEAIGAMSDEELQSLPVYQEALERAEGDIEKAREIAVNVASNRAYAQTFITTALTSLGLEAVGGDTLEKFLLDPKVAKIGMKKIFAMAGMEATEEAIQSGFETIISNRNTGRPLSEGVLQAMGYGAVTGAILGGAITGGASALQSAQAGIDGTPPTTEPTGAEPPALPPQPTPTTPTAPTTQETVEPTALTTEQDSKALNDIVDQLTAQEIKNTAKALGLDETSSRITIRRGIKEINGLREELQSADTPDAKLVALIKGGKSIREEVEEAKKPIMRQKAARVYANMANATGADLVGAVNRAMTGKLPQGQFEAPAEVLTRADVDSLYNTINNFDFGPKAVFDKANTITALTKLLSGQVPQTAELAKLTTVFGPDIAKAIHGKRPLKARVWEGAVDALSAPRTMKTMLDLSAMMRQGAMLSVAEAKSWGRSVPKMMNAMFSDANAKALDTAIKSDPRYDKAKESGLFIAPIDKSGPIAAREEAFASKFIDSLPGLGHAARVSERAYNGFLNSLRSDVFYKYVDQWGETASPKDYENLAEFINTATGRGKLGETGEKIAGELAAVFFSPRFVASRIQAPFQTLKFGKDANGKTVMAPAQKVAIKNLVGYYGAVLTMLTLAKMAGAEVEDDWRSSDFAKIKIGNTRIDLSAGIQPLLRHIGQILTGTRKSLSGDIRDVSRTDVMARFVRSKLAPGPGIIISALSGKTFSGDEFGEGGIGKTLWDELAPLIVDETISATQQEGPWAGLVSAVGEGIGVSVSTFEQKKKRKRKPRTRRRRR